MATVHVGRLRGPGGFSRNVAIKRMHAQYAKDSEFVAMFMHEAQLSAKISHPNVLPTIDVVSRGDEMYLVMDYIHGDSLARLLRSGPIEPAIVAGIMVQVLLGLHAAHEVRDDDGGPEGIIHRDVSPQNILVDEHGVARIVDFGIAKAVSSVGSTEAGKLKGKLAYMSPEQLNGLAQDRRVDVFAAGVVLFESLTGKRLFGGGEQAAVISRLMLWSAPDSAFEDVPEGFRAIAQRALAPRPEDRFDTAREMALAIQAAVSPARGMEIADWLKSCARETLTARAALIADMERTAVEETNEARGFDSLAPVPVSEPTSMASVKNVLREKSRQARWVGLFALLLCLIGLVAISLSTRAPVSEAPSSLLSGSSATAAPLTRVTTPPTEVAAHPTVSDIPIFEPDQLPAEAVHVNPPRPQQSPAARRPHVDCKVPFTVDAAGMKHFKPECFR